MKKLEMIEFLVRAMASPAQRRHLLRWFASLGKDYLLDLPSPWITFDAIEYIAAALKPGARIFEYGSGGSTLYWLKWRPFLVSVEHDPLWYEEVRGRIPAGPNLDYRLVLPTERDLRGSLPDPADPDAYGTDDVTLRTRDFTGYASAIDAFTDRSFDLVLVDGRARPSCIKHSVAKVANGGLLVLDNSERRYYLDQTGPLLTDFTPHRFSGLGPANAWTWETTVFVRDRG